MTEKAVTTYKAKVILSASVLLSIVFEDGVAIYRWRLMDQYGLCIDQGDERNPKSALDKAEDALHETFSEEMVADFLVEDIDIREVK